MNFHSISFFDRRSTETKPKNNSEQLNNKNEEHEPEIDEQRSTDEHSVERRQIAENSVALTVGHEKDRHMECLMRLTD